MTSARANEYGILTDEWLVSYASGSLNEGQALMVASHADFHPELQNKVRQAEGIGGAMLDDLEPAVLDQASLDSVMDMIEDTDADDFSVEASPLPVADQSVPSALAHYLGKSLRDLKWRTMGPGMKQVQLWSGPQGEKLWLLKAKGGTSIPIHDHRGPEMTLVLKGSYSVGGQHYTPGLLEFADTDLDNHQPIIDQGEECICLVVTEAPIRLHSLVARMAQPFIGL